METNIDEDLLLVNTALALAEAIRRHGYDITPCPKMKKWLGLIASAARRRFRDSTTSEGGWFYLWYNTSDNSTHLVRIPEITIPNQPGGSNG